MIFGGDYAMFSQSSDVWFITGCSTGFGRELAKLLIQRGYRTVVTARELHKIEDIAADHPGQALALKLDVTRPEDVAASVRQAESAFGRIDVLVNNAGYGYLGTLEESSESEARAMFETNFFGLARMTRAVLPGMRSRRRGCIVNISSIGGLVGFPGVGYYNATKFAVEGLGSVARGIATAGNQGTRCRAWAISHRLGGAFDEDQRPGNFGLCRHSLVQYRPHLERERQTDRRPGACQRSDYQSSGVRRHAASSRSRKDGAAGGTNEAGSIEAGNR